MWHPSRRHFFVLVISELQKFVCSCLAATSPLFDVLWVWFELAFITEEDGVNSLHLSLSIHTQPISAGPWQELSSIQYSSSDVCSHLWMIKWVEHRVWVYWHTLGDLSVWFYVGERPHATSSLECLFCYQFKAALRTVFVRREMLSLSKEVNWNKKIWKYLERAVS